VALAKGANCSRPKQPTVYIRSINLYTASVKGLMILKILKKRKILKYFRAGGKLITTLLLCCHEVCRDKHILQGCVLQRVVGFGQAERLVQGF